MGDYEVNYVILIKNFMSTNNESEQNKNSISSIRILNVKKIKIKKKKKVKKRMRNKKQSKNKIRNKNIINQSKEKDNNGNNEKLLLTKILEKLNDFEMSELNYEEALKYDKRNLFQIYISLIKTQHLFIFSFFLFNDYNSQVIKIYLFFFTFTMNLIVSAMFYSDSTMHKIYVDDGKFNFNYQLPQMVYSFIISSILENVLNNLCLYEGNIVDFKKINVNKKNRKKILKKIKIKIAIFFIIEHILLFLFWIYLGCFCAVYKNTQIHLLLDVLSSFSISFISPFFIVLFPCILRFISLKDKNGKRSILFKFSNFLLNFGCFF